MFKINLKNRQSIFKTTTQKAQKLCEIASLFLTIGVSDKMSAWLIAGIGVVYAVVAFDLIRSGNLGLGIAFVGYSIGNVGLTMEALKA